MQPNPIHTIFEDSISATVQKLDELGYFKYAKKNDLEELKTEVFNSLKNEGYLSTIHIEEAPYNSKDFRHYWLDGEALFEPDGFTNYFKDFGHFFKMIDMKFIITNHIEEWDAENEILNHSITINNKEYAIFTNFNGIGWSEAAKRFAEILNDQFIIQGKDEKIYLASGGNDGYAVILTEAQFNLLDPLLNASADRPLKIEDWCKFMQIN
ncbi:MAG: hypothetical protein JWP81_921 [Ferruginibacter sp.]|nr:hypothetical protein [Ferruginibacter sp.]